MATALVADFEAGTVILRPIDVASLIAVLERMGIEFIEGGVKLKGAK